MYHIFIKNGVYTWTGTFIVIINEHLCKNNVMKSVTFITKRPIYTIVIHIKREIKIHHIKELSLNVFKTKKSSLDCFNM